MLKRWPILVMFLVIAGCDQFGVVPIGKVLENPREYDGRTVVVSGTVTSRLDVLVVKGFVVKDETGEITVVTSRALPKTGQHVKVRGQVNQAFSLGQEDLVIIMEESNR